MPAALLCDVRWLDTFLPSRLCCLLCPRLLLANRHATITITPRHILDDCMTNMACASTQVAAWPGPCGAALLAQAQRTLLTHVMHALKHHDSAVGRPGRALLPHNPLLHVLHTPALPSTQTTAHTATYSSGLPGTRVWASNPNARLAVSKHAVCERARSMRDAPSCSPVFLERAECQLPPDAHLSSWGHSSCPLSYPFSSLTPLPL